MQSSQHLLPAVFSMFYWCINLGSFAAMATIPAVMQASVFWAFSIPGLFMLAALAVFFAGRKLYVIVLPSDRENRPAGFLSVTAFCAKASMDRRPGQVTHIFLPESLPPSLVLMM